MASGLVVLWTDWGRRASVAAGMGVALVALAADCPVWVACARGAGTLVALALIAHLGARVLAWSAAGDRREALAKSGTSGNAFAVNKERR